MHITNLVGQKFGKLEVIGRGEDILHSNRKRIGWLCRCECGVEKNISGENLKSGNSKSCGKCKSKKQKIVPSYTHDDLTGRKFDNIQVFEKYPNYHNYGHTSWRCVCDCGKEWFYSRKQIKRGYCPNCKKIDYKKKIENLIGTYYNGFLIKNIIQYKGAKSELSLICSCGNEFTDIYNGLSNRKRCPICNLNNYKQVRCNLVDKTFGELTVLDKFHRDKNGATWWDCKCSCGNIVSINVTKLTKKKATHCGCKYKRGRGYKYFGTKYPKKPRGRAKSLSLADRQRYKEWQQQVYKLNGHICCICKKRGGYLICHHLDGWNWCVAKRYDPKNAAVVCKKCHLNFHRRYGFGDNTRSQFGAFKAQFGKDSIKPEIKKKKNGKNRET